MPQVPEPYPLPMPDATGGSPQVRRLPAQKPPKPPLRTGQRRSALIAGGLSFALIGGSTTALVLYVIAAAATLVFAGSWQLALGAADEFGQTGVLLLSRGALYGGIFIVSCGLGYGVSLLILLFARVDRPHLTTLLGSCVALAGWSMIAGAFVFVYLAAAQPSQPGSDSPDVATVVLRVLIISLAMICCAAVGAGSWWLSAHLLRRGDVHRTGP